MKTRPLLDLATVFFGAYRTTREEIARLLAAVRRHLKDARYASIGDESRFDIAYKAVMQCALSR